MNINTKSDDSKLPIGVDGSNYGWRESVARVKTSELEGMRCAFNISTFPGVITQESLDSILAIAIFAVVVWTSAFAMRGGFHRPKAGLILAGAYVYE